MAPAPLLLLVLLAAGMTAQDTAEVTTVASNNASSTEAATTMVSSTELSKSTNPPGNSTLGAGDSSSSSSAESTASSTTEPAAAADPSTEASPSPSPGSSPSPSPSPAAAGNATDAETARNGTGRSISFPSENNSTHVEKGSLQDLSLDDIDMSMFMTTTTELPANASSSEGPETSTSPSTSPSTSSPAPADACVDGDARYRPGQRFNRSCEETCVCGEGGRASCSPRCAAPAFRMGSRTIDAACFERQAADPCCAVLVCADDSEPEPAEECVHKNETYRRGDSFKEGCESVCVCGEAGQVTCKPRCAPVAGNMSDRCVALPDPADPCCTVLRCDVTLTDHELPEAGTEEPAAAAGLSLVAAEAINSTAVRLEVAGGPLPDNATVEWSEDRELWRPAPRRRGPVLAGLEPGRTYFLRLAGSSPGSALQVALPSADPQQTVATQPAIAASADGCEYKGGNYTMGQEFHDGCKALCQCTEHGVECAELECPTDFGLDVLDPHCLEWELQPPGFVPSPPRCCPDEVRCRNNGSCEFAGELFANFAQIPARLAGCEQRCYCDAGNVTCHAACQPVPAAPPADLACPPHEATLDHVPGDDCCLYWTCPAAPAPPRGHSTPDYAVTSLPAGFQPIPGQPEEVVVQTLEPLDATSVRLVFSVPPVFVGLHGRIELRYTADKSNTDLGQWKLQVLAPPKDLLATPTLEFTLGDLQPDTEYRVKITVLLRDLHNTPSSPVLTVRTPPVPSSTLPPVVTVTPDLAALEVNTTWVTVAWRRFSEFELQLIDGVQLRYKQPEDKVYAATPLIHRAITTYTLEGLKPATTYEVRIIFIPFPGQMSELQADFPIQITTAQAQDLYKFEVHVEVHHIKATSVEVNWTGVPYPEDKYVNIYRAIYQSDSGKEDFSTFTVAKRDSVASTLIKDLSPGTRYRLWLEIYLTNGKIKKSNVQDFSTRPGSVSPVGSSQQGKLEGSAAPVREAGDYYSPLVAVAILAALAILATLILLLMLMRRRGQTKAAISAGRKSQSAYDNPSYKTCDDQPAANGNGSAKTTAPEPA